jgi:uncharacterized alpha-E superfamily protein
MLSRSTEKLYWLARYLERTENTARLVSVYMNLMFDLPKGMDMSWQYLLNVCGAEAAFFKRYSTPDEQNVMRFLLTETENPGSLFSTLGYARENMRTSRDLMPDEAWQQVNEMYLFTKNTMDAVAERSGRVLLLQEVMKGCQRFTGFLSGAMSHDTAFRLIKLGRNIERADMTTRILDIGPVLLADDRSAQMREYESNLWMHVLKSLSALLMYRKHRRLRINSGDVLDYLLKDTQFPRSVSHGIRQVQDCIRQLPQSEGFIENLATLETFIADADTYHMSPTQLRQLLDTIQARLAITHNQITSTWFLARDLP